MFVGFSVLVLVFAVIFGPVGVFLLIFGSGGQFWPSVGPDLARLRVAPWPCVCCHVLVYVCARVGSVCWVCGICSRGWGEVGWFLQFG